MLQFYAIRASVDGAEQIHLQLYHTRNEAVNAAEAMYPDGMWKTEHFKKTPSGVVQIVLMTAHAPFEERIVTPGKKLFKSYQDGNLTFKPLFNSLVELADKSYPEKDRSGESWAIDIIDRFFNEGVENMIWR